MKNIIKVTKENFKEVVLESSLPVLVDFYAEWCGPCKMLGPTLELLAEKYGDSIIVSKLNVDSNEDITSEYSVITIPTILIFKDGKVIDRFKGVGSINTYKSVLDKVLVRR